MRINIASRASKNSFATVSGVKRTSASDYQIQNELAFELKEVVAQQSFLNSPYSDPYQKRSLFLIRAAAKQHKAVINDLCRQLCGYSLHVVWRADGIDVEGNEVKAGEASQ